MAAECEREIGIRQKTSRGQTQFLKFFNKPPYRATETKMDTKNLTEEEKNELWKDDKFCLEKERKAAGAESLKLQVDYAQEMGRSFFGG